MPSVLPPPLVESLKGLKGFNETAFILAHQQPETITSIRLNPSKYSLFSFQYSIEHLQLPVSGNVPWCTDGKYLSERPSFTFDPFFHAGMYYVQEASSMFLWQVLQQTTGDNTSGLKVLDLCGAPGGKSTLLSSYFKNGLVVANEVIKQRAATLVQNIAKWGESNVVVTNNDPKDFKRLENYFDVLVVDAPCSGSGLFRKNASAVNEWSEEAVLLCSARQQRILADAYACLKQNGLLIYSTCSYSPQEDEYILDWLADTFQLSAISISIESEWNIVETNSSKHKAAGYRFYPDKVKGEGFFIAAFRKQDGSDYSIPNGRMQPVTGAEANMWKGWLENPGTQCLFKQNDTTIALPSALQSDLAFLQKHLYIKSAGTILGNIKGKDIIPHHALALSTMGGKQTQAYHFSKEQAIQYLQKKEITNLPINDKGWQLATYCGVPLGWMKVLPNRINNYYPQEWRILKN